jgi:Spy/CpxP family protein refolding chaperone
MKSMILAVVGAVLLSGAVAMAQGPTSRPTGGAGPGGGHLEQVLKELNLTPEQTQQVLAIFKTQEEAIKAAHEAAQKALEGVLGKEQLDKLRELMGRPGGFGARERIQMLMERAGLTDAQKTQAKAIIEAAHADAEKATDPKDKAAIWEAAFQKIVKDVLTDEQRAKLKEMRDGHDGGATSRPHHGPGGAGGNPPPPPPAGGANPPPPPPPGAPAAGGNVPTP